MRSLLFNGFFLMFFSYHNDGLCSDLRYPLPAAGAKNYDGVTAPLYAPHGMGHAGDSGH